MTVFKAYKAVNLGLPEITTFDIKSLLLGPTTPARFDIENGTRTVELDFRSTPSHPFNPPVEPPVSGHVGLLQVNTDTGGGLSPAYRLSGLNIPIVPLYSDVEQHKTVTILNLFFGGADTISGSPFADRLAGYGGNDRIIGGAGDDVERGGPGYDTFVFRAGFGHDTITDFAVGTPAAHETIELHSIPGLGSFGQVLNHAHLMGGHVVITANSGDSITLNNLTSLSSLHSFDFHFLP